MAFLFIIYYTFIELFFGFCHIFINFASKTIIKSYPFKKNILCRYYWQMPKSCLIRQIGQLLFDWKRICREVKVIQPLFYVRQKDGRLKMQAKVLNTHQN